MYGAFTRVLKPSFSKQVQFPSFFTQKRKTFARNLIIPKFLHNKFVVFRSRIVNIGLMS